MIKFKAVAVACEQLNFEVYRFLLRAQTQTPFEFLAGQYLELTLSDGRSAYFSIASPPEQQDELELHIRRVDDSELNAAILAALQGGEEVDLALPMGECTLDWQRLGPNTRLVFAAASTGFAQMKSMIEHLLAHGCKQPLYLYWGARTAVDIYQFDLCEEWARVYDNVHFIPMLSKGDERWQGRRGLISDVLAQDLQTLDDLLVFASGSPAMVYALVDALEPLGLRDDQIAADVFAYAPRRPKKA